MSGLILPHSDPAAEALDLRARLERQAARLAAAEQRIAELTARETSYRAALVLAEQQRRNLEILSHVRVALANQTELEGVFRAAVEAVYSAFGYALVSLYIRSDDVLVLQHQAGYTDPLPHIPLDAGVSGRVARSGQPVLLRDVRSDPDFLSTVDGVRSEICLPIVDDGRVVGVLNVETTDAMALNDTDLTLLLDVCEHLTIAVGRARVYAEGRRERDFSDALLDTVESLVIVVDRAGQIVRFNKACERATGYRFEEVRGAHFWELLVPPDRSGGVQATFERSRAEITPGSFEHAWVTRDGRLRLIAWSNTALRDAHGAVEYVIGTGIDITERRQAERELRESEATLRGFYDSTPFLMGVFELVDDDLVYLAINRVGAERFGVPQEQMPGRRLSTVLDAEHMAMWLEQCRASATTGRPVSFEYERRFGENLHWRLATVAPIEGAAAGRTRFAYVVNDISERKQMESALALARDAALESARLKSEFLATVSHEIRTPLNGVIGMTELLLATPLAKEQEQLARTADASAQVLLSIINDILDYSKIEAGKLTLDPDDVALAELIGGVIEIMRPQVREKQLSLVAEIGAGVPPVVRVDPGRLRQILLNLVGNAVKFTERGHVTVRVAAAESGADGPALRVTVSDTGVGIAPEALSRLFQPFVQADGTVTRRYGGTGLGLAICRSLVELMGGRIGCESAPGEGSTFWFETPLVVGAAAAAQPPAAAPESMPRTGHVLLAEDNPVNQQIAVRQLAQLGYTVEVAGDGSAALELLTHDVDRFQLVLMDCHMPRMDGYTCARAIRAMEGVRGGHVPIIAMTASTQRSDREASTAAGMDDFLSKPVRIAALSQMLDRWIGGGAAQPPSAPAFALDADVLSELRALTAGEPGLLAELAGVFIEEARAQVERLRIAQAAYDTATIARVAHTLRGSAAYLGARALAERCAELEARAATGDRRGIGAEVDALIDHVAVTTRQLAAEIGG